jgi:hypothetical protein
MVGLIIHAFALIGYLLFGVMVHGICNENIKNYDKLIPSSVSDSKLVFAFEVFSFTVLWPISLPIMVLYTYVVNRFINYYENKFTKKNNIIKQSLLMTESKMYKFYINKIKPLVK